MFYNHPVINTIDDVLPAIENSPEFNVTKKDGYTVIQYALITADTFPPVSDQFSAIRRECRGIIFDPDGKIISRPFHKFFNVNEREETRSENIDWSVEHYFLEKVDGSMVRPFLVNGAIRWGTKRGITDTSMRAEVYVSTHPAYINAAEYAVKNNITLIFEWIGFEDRIVVKYQDEDLILLAGRHNISGEYLSFSDLESISEQFGISLVKKHDIKSLKEVASWDDAEGVVVSFSNGHKVKCKSEWYVLCHKSKDQLTRENCVVKMIFDETVDDVRPFLTEADNILITSFMDKVTHGIDRVAAEVAEMVVHYRDICNGDRKVFAVQYSSSIDSKFRPLIFKAWDGGDMRDIFLKTLQDRTKNGCTLTAVNELRWMWGGTVFRYQFDGEDS